MAKVTTTDLDNWGYDIYMITNGEYSLQPMSNAIPFTSTSPFEITNVYGMPLSYNNCYRFSMALELLSDKYKLHIPFKVYTHDLYQALEFVFKHADGSRDDIMNDFYKIIERLRK